jgi:CBS domain-containing protein
MKLGEIATGDVISLSRAAALIEAAQLMCERGVGAVVVVESPADRPIPVGMITDRDIVRAQLERVADLSRLRIADVMSRDPLVLAAGDSIENALAHLRARGVRRAPVIDSSGALVGVVSTDDVLGCLARQLLEISSLVTGQHERTAPDACRARE